MGGNADPKSASRGNFTLLFLPYLSEWLGQSLQGVLVVAEFTAAAVGGSEPVFQAAPVDHGQRPCTLTGGEQLLLTPSVMTDPTHGPLRQRASAI